MLKKIILNVAKVVSCGILLSLCISIHSYAQANPAPSTGADSNQYFQMTTPEGLIIFRGIQDSSPSLTIRSNTDVNITTLPNGDTIVKVPDGQYAMKPAHGMPYCINGCDIPEDCNNGKHALHDGNQWTCQNAKGFCRGICVQESSKNPTGNNRPHGK